MPADAQREREQRNALAMEAITEGIYDWNVAADQLFVSDRLAEITGLTSDDLTAADWNDHVHPDDLAAYREAVARHFKGGSGRLDCEYRIRRKADDYVWVADRGICLRDERDLAIRLIGAIRDITARKLAEEKLRAAREDAERAKRQLVDAIESLSEGIVLFDRDDRIILCNSNYRQYFSDSVGDEVAEMVVPGASFWNILRTAYGKGMFPDITTDQIDRYLQERKERRRNLEGTFEQHLSDGRWLQINERRTAEGGTASVYTDITELKRREDELAEKTAMLEGVSAKLAKYLSPQVFASIFSGAQTVEVASKRKKLTVFFSDIAGFTEIADRLESEELTGLLNQYLTEMSKIALENGATVDKFIGDAILAFFGDPDTKGVKEDAAACVRMAIAMQRRMRELQAEWRDRGLEQAFELRIGINTGFCTVGNFGSEDRLDYTVVGTEVNLAARLQARAEVGGILLASETYSLVKDAILGEEQKAVRVKGIATPVKTYKVVGTHDNLAVESAAIQHTQEGFHLIVDRSKLKGRAKATAIKALEDAVRKLRD